MGAIRSEALGPVVAATDFSQPAHVALEWARAVAMSRGLPLHLVHALPIPVGLSDPCAMALPSALAQLEAAARRDLEALARRERELGLDVRCHLQIGPPAYHLDALSRELDASLLVVGTRGLTGLRSLLLGSTARRVLSHAPCPVLAVHPEERPPGSPLQRLLLATDLELDESAAIASAARLFGFTPAGSRLCMLHVKALPAEYLELGREEIPTPVAGDTIERELAARLEERAAALRRAGWILESRLGKGSVAATIVEEARRWGADLVVVRTHGRTGMSHLLLGSVAERVVQLAESPVLVVPPDRAD